MEQEKNHLDSPDMPLGLGMALAQNMEAMNRFSALTEQQKRSVIAQTHQINSKAEMDAFARQIAGGSIG